MDRQSAVFGHKPALDKSFSATGISDAEGGVTRSVQRERCLTAARESKEFLLEAPQKIDTERLTYLLDTYRNFDHEPVVVRRAVLFDWLLRGKRIFIDSNPIVGTVTGYPAGIHVYPEWAPEWIIEEINQSMLGHLGEVRVTPEEKNSCWKRRNTSKSEAPAPRPESFPGCYTGGIPVPQ